MKNVTPEFIAQAKAANSPEELWELVKANNVELTAEETKICFDQLAAQGEISDDELEAVAGGISLTDDLAILYKYKDKLWEILKNAINNLSK